MLKPTQIYTWKSGFALVETMLVVVIIGLLTAVAIPNLMKAREATQKNICIANLKQIYVAKQQWAIEESKSGIANVKKADLYGPALYIKQEPLCPSGGVYKIKNVKDIPDCSLNNKLGHSFKPKPIIP